MTRETIIVMKGNFGFGDRLQVLSYCLSYCNMLHASLCVDWRDSIWGRDFSDYFDIVGIPTVTLEYVAKKIEMGAQVNPGRWTADLMRSPPQITLGPAYNLLYNAPIVHETCVILVFNCTGFRRYDAEHLVNHLRFTRSICDLIRERLPKQPYSLVHIRGTDRLHRGENPLLMLGRQFQSKKIPENMLVISDTETLMNQWLKKYPNCRPLHDIGSATRQLSIATKYTNKGLHLHSHSELATYKITKHDLNLECLVDFVALSSANAAFGNTKSCFFSMARLLHGSIDKLMNHNLNTCFSYSA